MNDQVLLLNYHHAGRWLLALHILLLHEHMWSQCAISPRVPFELRWEWGPWEVSWKPSAHFQLLRASVGTIESRGILFTWFSTGLT